MVTRPSGVDVTGTHAHAALYTPGIGGPAHQGCCSKNTGSWSVSSPETENRLPEVIVHLKQWDALTHVPHQEPRTRPPILLWTLPAPVHPDWGPKTSPPGPHHCLCQCMHMPSRSLRTCPSCTPIPSKASPEGLQTQPVPLRNLYTLLMLSIAKVIIQRLYYSAAVY